MKFDADIKMDEMYGLEKGVLRSAQHGDASWRPRSTASPSSIPTRGRADLPYGTADEYSGNEQAARVPSCPKYNFHMIEKADNTTHK
eukprot:16445956-Heterocapsa_arctica.AAC.1